MVNTIKCFTSITTINSLPYILTILNYRISNHFSHNIEQRINLLLKRGKTLQVKYCPVHLKPKEKLLSMPLSLYLTISIPLHFTCAILMQWKVYCMHIYC